MARQIRIQDFLVANHLLDCPFASSPGIGLLRYSVGAEWGKRGHSPCKMFEVTPLRQEFHEGPVGTQSVLNVTCYT